MLKVLKTTWNYCIRQINEFYIKSNLMKPFNILYQGIKSFKKKRLSKILMEKMKSIIWPDHICVYFCKTIKSVSIYKNILGFGFQTRDV